ncbi:hypothetical protein SAMN05444405_10541 [Bacteroides luti]|uniref:YD repeat-containing protein n=1 Tax=Bacteroides luti TaxID=1297750 RepID=A0A1M4YP72_9BACE|nr:hypothetical protein [Bacteroides luti]SHF07570.1 hypothetical protein SAMN05444405_10541 [Bacteroides luti]
MKYTKHNCIDILFIRLTRCLNQITLFILFSLQSLNSYSQSAVNQLVLSPEIGSILRFDKIPVNLYNGIPEINIPLYEITLKKISLPISLNYHAGGNKVDLYPNSAGLGWNIYAGGCISRINNGNPDKEDPYDTYFDKTQMIDWNSNNNLSKYQFNKDTNEHLRTPDLDEFVINVGKINASFYIYKDIYGKTATKIASKNNSSFKVEIVRGTISNFTLVESTIFNPYLNKSFSYSADAQFAKSFIKEIRVTDSEGIVYLFGGEPDALEISYEYRQDPDYGKYYDADGNLYPQYADSLGYHIRPSGFKSFFFGKISVWNLKKIITPQNENIVFNYDNSKLNIVEHGCAFSRSYMGDGASGPYSTNDSKMFLSSLCSDYNLTYVYPSKLKSITVSTGEKILFQYSKRNDLKSYYSITDEYGTDFLNIHDNVAACYSNFLKQNIFLKLDNIDINNKLKINFDYIENPDERLKLKCLTFQSSSSRASLYYKFCYNQKEKLPKFWKREKDNWGYYNGKDYGFLIKNEQYDKLYDFRQPDSIKMKAEILESITYPTGGKVYFEFEPHYYSKIVDKFPFGISSKNGMAGGLRIKSIIMHDGSDSTKNITKKYYYLNKDLSSSGILSQIPIYWAQSIGTYENCILKGEYKLTQKSENYINWISGNTVTYSRVIEEQSDGNKTIYNYSNYDKYNDESPLNVLGVINPNIYNRYTSRDLDRGLLTEMEFYDCNNKRLKKEVKSYNSNYDEYLRNIDRYSYTILPERISANKIYTYYPSLKKEEISYYFKDDSIKTIKEYKYGSDRQIKEISTNDSKNGFVRTVFYYPQDYKDIEPYKSMVDSNLISPIIKQEIYKNEKLIETTTTDYKNNNGLFLPSILKIKKGSFPEKNIKTYYNYDSYGNIIYETDDKAINNVYLWGYKGKYPIAVIKNTTYDKVKSALGTNPETFSPADSVSPYLADQLRKSIILNEAQIYTYRYEPFIGVKSIVEPNGTEKLYNYNNWGNLLMIIVDKNKIAKEFSYHYRFIFPL